MGDKEEERKGEKEIEKQRDGQEERDLRDMGRGRDEESSFRSRERHREVWCLRCLGSPEGKGGTDRADSSSGGRSVNLHYFSE